MGSLKRKRYLGGRFWHQVLQRDSKCSFVFLVFPWWFLKTGDERLQMSPSLSTWCHGAHGAGAGLWKPAFGLEPSHRHTGQTGGSISALVSPPLKWEGWPWCLLFGTSRSTAEKCSTKVMLLLAQETFPSVNFESSIQKITLSHFSKITGSHYSRCPL